MSAKARMSLILLALALGLLAFIVFFERGTVSTAEREGRKGRVLDNFVRDRVTRVEVQRKGQTTVLVRVPANEDDPLDVGGWRVEQPYAAAADQTSVDSLLGALEWIEPRRTLGGLSAKEQQEFGLTRPRYRVAFVVGGKRVSFSIGGAAADSGSYLQLHDRPLAFVVGKDVVEAFDHEPADYHTKELHAGVSMLTLLKLRLNDAQGERRIERNGGYEWLLSPYRSLAAGASVSSIVNGLDGLRASRFVETKPKQLAQYGLDAPSFTLSLNSKAYDKNAKTKSTVEQLLLRLGSACAGHAGETYLRVDDGPIFCAAEADLKPLRKTADELRETRLLPLDDNDIRGVRLQSGQLELVLEQADKTMRYRLLDHGRETKHGTVDPYALADWYKSLRAVTIERFEPVADKSSPRPEFVRATFDRGKELVAYVVRLHEDPSGMFATRLDETTHLRVPQAARELLAPYAARFRAKRVLDEDESQFTKLVVTGSSNVVETVTRSSAGYALSGPVNGTAQRASVDDILRLVSKLDAVRFVADAAQAAHGFTNPYRRLSLEYKTGPTARTHVLVLGAVSGDEGRFAKLDDDPSVFVVSNALVQKLDDPLLSHAAPAVAYDELTGLEISAGARRVRVERDAQGAFTIVGEAASAARADALARALAALHASRVTGYGKPGAAEGMDRPEARITAKLRDGTAVTWAFGSSVSGSGEPRVYLRRSGLDVGFEVPRSALDALLEHKPSQ